MANQTISSDTNHDAATGRSAGENFTINSGAVLTIDSMPHLTAMGILGDITISDGTLRIDGSRTYELAYSGGTGTLPSVLDAITWGGGAYSGKVVRLNSGAAASGVMTITMDVGSTPPVAADTLVSGGWSADVDSAKFGYLIVYGEDQDWGSVDARSSLIITGEWYELGVGTGADSQAFTLPHSGHQPAVWVETGSGTGVFEIWFRVNVNGGSVYFDPDDYGTNFESGFVFSQVFGSSTLTFGTSTAGGVPPSGARIRIPNVHIGTTTTGAPTTEINAAAVVSHIGVVAPNTNLNVNIDHLNGSSCYIDFRGTNAVSVADSCWGLATSGNLINRVNAEVSIENCCLGPGGLSNYAAANVSTVGILDNVGGVTFTDVVIHGGINSNNASALALTTMANLDFAGVCKIVANQQDENTMASIRASIVPRVTAETLIILGAPLVLAAGCADWQIQTLVYGLPPGRGTTEQNIITAVNATGVSNLVVREGRLASGAKHGTSFLYSLTDCDNVRVYNHGSITAKIDGEGRCTGVANLAGITTNTVFKRVWYTNLNASQSFLMLNSVADVRLENCSGDYNDELEFDATRLLAKGVHGASGNPDAATGVEGDNVNVLATCFLDYFKSDTTGALGLMFNDRGQKHLNDIEITAGAPIWNGLGDLLMRTAGDQVVYTWPYQIKGHTGFANLAIEVSAVGSYDYEYDLDTGAGFSGSWTTINGSNLSAETISPAGFGFKIRITCTASGSTNAIKGLAVRTTTTLADQEANFYPLDVFTLTLSGIQNLSEVRVFDAANPLVEIGGQEEVTGGIFSLELDPDTYPSVNISVISLGYLNLRYTAVPITADTNITVQQQLDRQYLNP